MASRLFEEIQETFKNGFCQFQKAGFSGDICLSIYLHDVRDAAYIFFQTEIIEGYAPIGNILTYSWL